MDTFAGLPSARRLLHSIHPSLATQYAAARNVLGTPESQHVPYPTRQQHAQAEAEFISALQEGENPGTAVRQPPSMLAALQREDLVPAARQKLLARISPLADGSALEAKYKLIMSSDARRDPLSAPTHDFEVDVGPDLLRTRVNGFELVGYSMPQADWVISPEETALPIRWGWCAEPGARRFSVHLQDAPTSAPYMLTAEMPLPRNPIVSARILAAQPEADVPLPRRLQLILMRRTGAALPAVASAEPGAVRLVGCWHVGGGGGLVGTLPLSRDSFLETVQEGYLAAEVGDVSLSPEPPVDADMEAGAGVGEDNNEVLNLHTITLTAPEVLAHFAHLPDGTTWEAGSCVGYLAVDPPTHHTSMAARLNVQLATLLAHRRWLERSEQNHNFVGPPATAAFQVSSLRVNVQHPRPQPNSPQPSSAAARFTFEARAFHHTNLATLPHNDHAARFDSLPHLCVAGVSCDPALRSRFGLPVGGADELMARASFTPSLVEVALPGVPPTIAPVPARTAPVAPGDGDSDEGYFRALIHLTSGFLYTPQPSAPDPQFFVVAVQPSTAASPSLVPIASGEYRPDCLAAAITRAARAVPALAPLRITCRVVGVGGEGGWLPGAEVLGFSFASETGLPFALRFDLAASDPQLLPPERLGYASTTSSLFSPTSFSARHSPTATQPLSFPVAHLGLGTVQAFPAIPYLLPITHYRRLQVIQGAKPTERVVAMGGVPSENTAPAILPLTLARAARFHPLQKVSLTVRILPETLLFGDVAGTAEQIGTVALAQVSSALAAIREGQAAAGTIDSTDPPLLLSDVPLATVLALFSSLHDPLLDQAGALFDVLVRLLGKLGTPYGTSQRVSSGPMTTDGPYRIVLAAFAAQALPMVDALLAQVADGVQLRASVSALSGVLGEVIRGPILQGTPIHLAPPPISTLASANGGVASQGMAILLAAAALITGGSAGVTTGSSSSTSTASGPSLIAGARDVLHRILLSALNTGAAETLALPTTPSSLVPGRVYSTTTPPHVPVTSTLHPSRLVVYGAEGGGVTLFEILPGESRGAGDVVVVDGVARTVAQYSIASASPIPVDAGSLVAVTYPSPHVADPVISAGIQDVSHEHEQPAESHILWLRVDHNPASDTAAITFNGGATTLTLQISDSPVTTLAKAALVAGNYHVNLDGWAAEGNQTDPSASPAALLFRPATYPVGQLSSVAVALSSSPSSLWIPPWLLARELTAIALLTPGDSAAVTLSRAAEFPFSLDFASSLVTRIAPGRLGFVNGTEVAARALHAESTTSLSAQPPAAIFSPVEVDRTPPPYLLLGVTINGGGGGGSAAGATSTAASADAFACPAGTNSEGIGSASPTSISTNPSLKSISSPGNAIACTAYVEIGGDSSITRALDKTDDRSPVVFPTSTYVHKVRVTLLRPDGSPYPTHNGRVMVALRFFGQADNVNVFPG